MQKHAISLSRQVDPRSLLFAHILKLAIPVHVFESSSDDSWKGIIYLLSTRVKCWYNLRSWKNLISAYIYFEHDLYGDWHNYILLKGWCRTDELKYLLSYPPANDTHPKCNYYFDPHHCLSLVTNSLKWFTV